MPPILHPELPFKVWMDSRLARLPGIVPMPAESWLVPDAAYGPQMAERERLIAGRPDQVHALLPEASTAAEELYRTVAARLPGMGFVLRDGVWTCPDGRRVADDPGRALITLGKLVQDDLCLLQPGAMGEHVLTGAILCFPAGWTLTEKIGRPLLRVHKPVADYSPDLARRVQRLFDAIRPGMPLMRGNALAYADPGLYQPRREGVPRMPPADSPGFIRSEWQGLVRLPESGAVVFSIRTYVVPRISLSQAEELAFAAWCARH